MSARRPRLLTKIGRKKPKEDVSVLKPYVPPAKTEVDVLYDLIDERSCRGYRLCESNVSLPYIHKEDIENRGGGLFVVRFRCPVENEVYGLPQVIKEVCERMGSDEHFVYEKKEEFGLPFIEAAWVLQRGEVHAPEVDFSGCIGGEARGDAEAAVAGGVRRGEAHDEGDIPEVNPVSNGGRGDAEAREDPEASEDAASDSCISNVDGRDEPDCSLSDEETRRMMDAADCAFA